jgi:hypothetical protein
VQASTRSFNDSSSRHAFAARQHEDERLICHSKLMRDNTQGALPQRGARADTFDAQSTHREFNGLERLSARERAPGNVVDPLQLL